MKLSKNQDGNVLIVVLVLTAVIAMGAMTILSRSQTGQKVQEQSNLSGIAEQIKSKLVGAVMSPQSWQIIQQRNAQVFGPAMQYATSTTSPLAGGTQSPKSLDIYLENSRTPYYAATNPRAGFDMQGNPCDPKQPFSLEGNDQCPFRYNVTLISHVYHNNAWIDTLRFELLFRPKNTALVLKDKSERFTFNLVRNVDENNVEATCLSLEGVYDKVTGTCSKELGQDVICPDGKSYRGSVGEKCAEMKIATKTCSAGQAVTGFDNDGNPVCAAVDN